MIKVLGENYYVDLDEIENYLDMTDDSSIETISGGSETRINIIKFEMVKMMLEIIDKGNSTLYPLVEVYS